MTLRDERQAHFAKIAEIRKKGILYLAPRFGKIKTCFNFIKDTDKVLIIYPKLPIKTSWIDDSKKWNKDISNFTFTTTASVKNHIEKYDWVIWDEPQEVLSEKVLWSIRELSKINNIIALSGSLSSKSLMLIEMWTGLKVIAEYPTSLGIKEKVITDYKIVVHYCELEQKLKTKYDTLSKEIEYALEHHKSSDAKFKSLARMRLLQSASNKIKATKELLHNFANDRVLVFSHLTKFIDQLEIPVYHSKNKENAILEEFKEGNINHLGTLDMISAGITFKKINKTIIATFTSNTEELYQRINRITSIEMENPDKKAVAYIICIKNTQEEKWLKSALALFDKSKIFYE